MPEHGGANVGAAPQSAVPMAVLPAPPSSPPPASPVAQTSHGSSAGSSASRTGGCLARHFAARASLLLLAVSFMSSAATAFALLEGVPPLLKASWRLWVTSALQAPAFAVQWRSTAPARRARWKASWPMLLVSGFFLAVHFGAWVWSIDHTSIAHSLLWVSSHPLIIVALLWSWAGIVAAAHRVPCCGPACVRGANRLVKLVAWASSETHAAQVSTDVTGSGDAKTGGHGADAQGKAVAGGVVESAAGSVDARRALEAAPSPRASIKRPLRSHVTVDATTTPPNVLETAGAIVGFAFGAVMVADVEAGSTVTVEGDAVAFLGAFAMVVYLASGRTLRSWMPLFLYAFPVTLCSAVFSFLFSLMLGEGTTFDGVTTVSLFGWVGSWLAVALTGYQAAGPGLLGHTMVNNLLRFFTPLVVSVSLLLEPLIGSVIGWIAGKQDVPGLWTWIGGPGLVAGAVCVTIGAARREAAKRSGKAPAAGSSVATDMRGAGDAASLAELRPLTRANGSANGAAAAASVAPLGAAVS